jgi:hypothetical protein
VRVIDGEGLGEEEVKREEGGREKQRKGRRKGERERGTGGDGDGGGGVGGGVGGEFRLADLHCVGMAPVGLAEQLHAVLIHLQAAGALQPSPPHAPGA